MSIGMLMLLNIGMLYQNYITSGMSFEPRDVKIVASRTVCKIFYHTEDPT